MTSRDVFEGPPEKNSSVGSDLLAAMAILLGMLATAVIFWMYPFITAGAFAIFIASIPAARGCGQLQLFHSRSPARHMSMHLH